MTRSRRGPRPRAPLALIALAATAAAAAPPPSGTIPVADGVQLAYRTVGDGTETVVIPMVVEQQVEWMAPLATGRRLIFYNPRGRGRSTAIDPKLVSYANELADLEQVREVAMRMSPLCAAAGGTRSTRLPSTTVAAVPRPIRTMRPIAPFLLRV
ncbi:MAG: alpha/beta hydrolase, partial [Chloroflexi bacterium]|nr:alpha/beta hydrolase [Chloroflexota bacterium]